MMRKLAHRSACACGPRDDRRRRLGLPLRFVCGPASRGAPFLAFTSAPGRGLLKACPVAPDMIMSTCISVRTLK